MDLRLDNVQSPRIRRALLKLPPSTLQKFRVNGIGQLVIKEEPYFSKFRVRATVTDNSGTSTFAITARTEFTAFDYSRAGGLIGASQGFPASTTPTRADTNLLTASETNNNEWFFVDGVGVAVLPNSDAELLRRVWGELYCSIGMGGKTDQIRLGPPAFWPAGIGLYGSGVSQTRAPNLAESFASQGFITNGIPDPNAVRWLSDPLIWGPKAEADSNLVFSTMVERAISYQATDRAAATGVAAYAAPNATDADGTYVELLAVLYGIQVETRGSNR